LGYRLLLIRHGLTLHNLQYRYTGWGDPALTDLGQEQARLMAQFVAKEYGVDRLYASPLTRAWQTAGALGEAIGLAPRECADLREMFFGDVEGLTAAEFQSRFPETYAEARKQGNLDFRWPNGEHRGEFFSRVKRCVDGLMVPPEGTIAVVTHGGVISGYLAQTVGGSPRRWLDYSVTNCSVTELEAGDGMVELKRLDHNAFLAPVAEQMAASIIPPGDGVEDVVPRKLARIVRNEA
jgi:broad specificity phosphatase PhoE